MKALVTGADGFIGSHLVELLLAKGWQVRALAQYNSFNHWGWLEDVPDLSEVELRCGDIRDAAFCRSLVDDVEVVFHLAALIAIPYSYQAPDCYVDTNIKGTLNICQAALEKGVRRVVHTSTSEVYGTAQYVPIDEKHPLQPQSPYSASKIAADAMALSFYHSFDLPLAVARPFNTYGPRQSARAVIPAIIAQLAAGKTELQLGELASTRDFNFVGDTCRGFLAIADSDEAIGKALNICTGKEISIGDLAHRIQVIMGTDSPIVTDDQRLRPAGSEVYRLCGDHRALAALTDYQPEVSLEEGLQKTINWFSQPENLRHYKAHLYNV